MGDEKLDLLYMHGVEQISLHVHFPNTKASTEFLKDYAFNENKGIRLEWFKGLQKMWVCDSADCPWFVELTQKRAVKNPSKARITKLSHIPAGAWFVSKLQLSHSDMCMSVRKCSARQIQALSGFKGSIVHGLDTSMTRVVRSLQEINSVNVSTNQPRCIVQSRPRKRTWRLRQPLTTTTLP